MIHGTHDEVSQPGLRPAAHRKGRRALAALVSAGLVAAPALLSISPASASTGAVRPLAAGSTGTYHGSSNGTAVYAQLVSYKPLNKALAEGAIEQSAAAVGPDTTLPTKDQLGETIFRGTTTGHTAYGHGAAVQLALGQAPGASDQAINTGSVEASSPAPSSAAGQAGTVPLAPLANLNILPSSAAANTTADNACVIGKPISTGQSHVVDGDIGTANIGGKQVSLVHLDKTNAVVGTTSTEQLVQPTLADGTKAGGVGLVSQTVQTFAPITLFKNTPAEITIAVLAPLKLAAQAGGTAGTSVVSYAPVGIGPTDPLVSITAMGKTQTLTTQQVLGPNGLQLHLGAADVVIGAPAHSLTGYENTTPSESADGTATSAASDLIRISIPGTIAVAQNPFSGPLAPLNNVLNPVIAGLQPVLTQIQNGLASAGLNVADLRVGHMEVQSNVPVGGIQCGPNTPGENPNPFTEAYKDVSARTVAPGQTFTYTVRFPNRSTLPVTNATVVDTFTGGPPPLEFVSSVPAPSSAAGNTLTYNVGTVQPNQFVDIVMTFRAPAGAAGITYHNSAVINGTFAGTPLPPTTVTVNGPTVSAPSPGTGCVLNQSTKFASNKQVFTGENFAYYVNVLNSGDASCTGVTVNDKLGAGVSFVSANLGGTNNAGTVTWSLGSLSPGQSVVLSIVVKVTATSGTLPNAAVITSTNGGSGNPSTPGPTVTGITEGNPGTPAGCATGLVCASGSGGGLAHTGASTGLVGLALVLLLSGIGVATLIRRRSAE
jgi:uncharacterized repeat protein (TIGR01451 family)